MSSPQTKFVLTSIYTYLELWKLGFDQAKYEGRGTCLEWLKSLGKSSASLGMSVGDPWQGMASPKSHVSELMWIKAKCRGRAQSWWRSLQVLRSQGGVLMTWGIGLNKNVGVELRAGRDLHRPEKPGWSASDMRPWPKKKDA